MQDEVFHVPQAQQYCSHNFSHWNPMITTLPGLYLSSLLWAEPLSWLMQTVPASLCHTAALRAQNLVLLVLLFFLLHLLLRTLHAPRSGSQQSFGNTQPNSIYTENPNLAVKLHFHLSSPQSCFCQPSTSPPSPSCSSLASSITPTLGQLSWFS